MKTATLNNNLMIEKIVKEDSMVVNLKKETCDRALLEHRYLEDYISMEFIPWRQVDGLVYIASSKINNELKEFLGILYPAGFLLVRASLEDITLTIQRNFNEILLDKTLHRIHKEDERYSAKFLLSLRSKVLIIITVMVILYLLIKYLSLAIIGMIIVANLINFINTVFKIIIFAKGYQSPTEQFVYPKETPKYTVMVPLYKEEHVLVKLISSLEKLNYPQDKLEIIFIVEQFDRCTIRFINRLKRRLFKVICVPRSTPKTKPKACSYVLNYINSKYLAIYDAEDRPEPDQLLKAVAKFEQSPNNVACLQARLGLYNSNENILSSCFAIEFFCWFRYFLNGLLRLKMPIPLGGTSNHFKVEILKKIGGWDPYNVTEDADIGYRLFKKGYKVAMIDSDTLEESPNTIQAWLKQRVRWIKGHLQTYIVHLRTHKHFKTNAGKRGVLAFHLFIFFPILSYLTNILLLPSLLVLNHGFLMTIISLLNYAFHLIVSWIFACVTLRNSTQTILKKSLLWYGFYTILHSIASLGALYQLITRPYYWNKTEHNFDYRNKRDLTGSGC